jgi:DNA-binding SARP family transcriptional activator
MGIGRARKLLGDDSLIQVQDGRIFLDDKRVFVDTWAFDEIEQVIRDTERQPPSRLRMEELGQQLIALYVGRLFDDDDSLTASAILIEQFRERFINMVTLLARTLARHDLRGAMDLLQRAIEREPYSERLYRSLIEQLANAGEYAEAMRWYRRCQHAVSQAYGVAISPNTEALLALIRMPPPNPPVES